MMNKKIIKSLLVCGILCNVACSSNEGKNVKDGTYQASAEGYNGEIQVSVTFESGNITNIEIDSENETDIISDAAIKNVTKYIKQEQSVNVDVQTGATVTSQGIIDAVKETIQEAHGDVNEWNEDATGKHSTKEVDKESDVVIVGGGISGIIATLRLQQLGVNCILVEKSDTLGGIMRYGGNYTQLYVESSEDTKELSSATLPSLITDNLQDTVTWQIEDLGIIFNETEDDDITLTEYAKENTNIGELLATEVEVSGAEILTETYALGLEKDDSTVTGITAMNKDGEIYHISADHIIIATGNNDSTFYSYNTGDMNTILTEEGYDVTSTYSDKQYNLALKVYDSTSVDTYYASRSVMDDGLVLVDSEGNRYVNECEERLELNNIVKEDSYLVMNASTYKKWMQKIQESSCLDEDAYEELEGIYVVDTLEELSDSTGISYKNLLETIEKYNECSMNEEIDAYGREDKGNIDPDEEIYCVKLSSVTLETNGGISVDDNLNIIDSQTNTSVENVYAIGSATNHTSTLEGEENTWAFVSGKVIADKIGALYE